MLALTVAGCGSRSGLTVDPEPVDAGTPVAIWTECGAVGAPITRPGEPLTLRITAAGAPASRARWSIARGASSARLDPDVGDSVRFTASEPGGYRVRAELSGEGGVTAQCTVEVEVVEGLGLFCGASVHRGAVGETLLLGVSVVGGPPRSVDWAVVESPPAAEVELRPSGASASFRGTVGGVYRVHVRARSEAGVTECNLTVELGPRPPVECPEVRIATVVGASVALLVGAVPPRGAVSWTLLERPDGSRAGPAPTAGPATTVVPDVPGTYRVAASVSTLGGLTSDCLTQILATPAPPQLTCPETVVTRPLESTSLRVSVARGRADLRYRWTLVERPRGSRAELGETTGESAELTPDLAGSYQLRVEVSDDLGWSATCEIEVRAEGLEGLRVEMFWDTDRSDMDLHLLHPAATEWYGELDCYFRNCQEAGGLPWGATGLEDNPRLAIDERFGFGPENTNVQIPEVGTYRVGVRAFDDDGNVEVRIYCGSGEPVAELGPVHLDQHEAKFWRVADVEILATGGCRIHPLGGRRPDIITENTARRER